MADFKYSGRSTSVNTAGNAALVATSLQHRPCKSTNRLSIELGISCTSVQNIRCKNGHHPLDE